MKTKIITALILVIMILLTSCNTTPSDTTAAHTETEPAATAKETETETETEPLPVPLDLAENVVCEMAPVYREKETVRSGDVKISSLKLGVSYDSTFYGAHSAIHRPFTVAAAAFTAKTVNCSGDFNAQSASADLNGDALSDVITYKDGVLSAYTVTAVMKKDQTYIFDTNNKYSANKLFSFDIGGGAKLCGAGDLNGDGYNDILFTKNGEIVIYRGSENGFTLSSFRIDGVDGELLCGDADGDGIYDLLTVKGASVTVYRSTGEGFEKTSKKEIKPAADDYEKVLCADFNCDKYADILYLIKNGDTYKTLTVFGHGDGAFGTETDNKNLYSECEFEARACPQNVCAGDVTGNGAADLIGYGTVNNRLHNALYFNNGDFAYDYSLFGMKVNGEYRLYSGCRWKDNNYENSDGDHVMLSTSKDGRSWYRYIDKPMFYLGMELGIDEWWSDNTLEPEVLYVDGKYHMYWQCSYTTPKGKYGDKIGYAVSDDGINWERKTDEPAIICENPEIGFNHEEVIYVADDPDGKPFWMYTGHFVNGQFCGYIRIRSADPTRFEYKDKESTSGFAEIGNQIGYLTDKNGERIFFRITFASEKNTNAPTLQFSRDGLKFAGSSDLLFASVDQDDPRNELNKKVFFLGIATENGTGEIKQNEDGTYTVMYFATTCASSVAPEIFRSDGGVGVATITLTDLR